jgi:leader peptidase (prepilin peptidase)/N-methyltransferase
MIIAVLVVLGLILGSFVNALVWRVREQEKHPKNKKLSVLNGRSMCPHCKHELAAKDLAPVVSWLWLRGKCRYCGKPISKQYPVVEALTGFVFVASYIWWPHDFRGLQTTIFVFWLVFVTGLMALLVYDYKWMILPNRIIYPLSYIGAALAILNVIAADHTGIAILNTFFAILIGGGLFYGLFQLSGGKWIGGGDVKLGWLLGLVLATPARSLLMIFTASLMGSLMSIPLLFSKKLKRTSTIPFGPFLIIAAILVQLFGQSIINWYTRNFINF